MAPGARALGSAVCFLQSPGHPVLRRPYLTAGHGGATLHRGVLLHTRAARATSTGLPLHRVAPHTWDTAHRLVARKSEWTLGGTCRSKEIGMDTGRNLPNLPIGGLTGISFRRVQHRRRQPKWGGEEKTSCTLLVQRGTRGGVWGAGKGRQCSVGRGGESSRNT